MRITLTSKSRFVLALSKTSRRCCVSCRLKTAMAPQPRCIMPLVYVTYAYIDVVEYIPPKAHLTPCYDGKRQSLLGGWWSNVEVTQASIGKCISQCRGARSGQARLRRLQFFATNAQRILEPSTERPERRQRVRWSGQLASAQVRRSEEVAILVVLVDDRIDQSLQHV